MSKGDCQSGNKFRVPLQQTMQQMLQSLMNNCNRGQGEGRDGQNGAGAGQGGTASSGSSASGYMQQNMPIYGPTRLEYDMPGLAYGEYKPGAGRTRSRGKVAVGSDLEGSSTLEGSDNRLDADAVPLKYKDAVKKYFSEPNKNESLDSGN